MWNLTKNKNTKTKLIDTEKQLVVAIGGGLGMGKMEEEDQKIQPPRYKINEEDVM